VRNKGGAADATAVRRTAEASAQVASARSHACEYMGDMQRQRHGCAALSSAPVERPAQTRQKKKKAHQPPVFLLGAYVRTNWWRPQSRGGGGGRGGGEGNLRADELALTAEERRAARACTAHQPRAFFGVCVTCGTSARAFFSFLWLCWFAAG
jgi:hypothetical protein